MTFKLNDIFTSDDNYADRAKFCNENGYIIKEIEPQNEVRQFQIVEAPTVKVDTELSLLDRITALEEALIELDGE